MARVNVSLAQAIVTTNERYYRRVEARLQRRGGRGRYGLRRDRGTRAALSPPRADRRALATRSADLWVARERERLLDLRAALHEAASAMDQATLQVRARRRS